MRQIDVGTTFDSANRPLEFISNDGRLAWDYGVVESADWRDLEGQAAAIKKVSHDGHEVVSLFDGTDCMLYASMKDAIFI